MWKTELDGLHLNAPSAICWFGRIISSCQQDQWNVGKV